MGTIYPTVPVAQPEAASWADTGDAVSIQADEMFARQLDNEMADGVHALFHDPDKGLLARSGEDALAGIPDTMAALGGIRERVLGQALGARQRGLVEPLVDQRLEAALKQIGGFARGVTARLDDEVTDGRIERFKRDAGVAWDDLERLRLLGRAATTERRYQGERRGWEAGKVEAKVRRDLSDLYATAVERAIQHDPEATPTLYKHARAVIADDRRSVLERLLMEASEDKLLRDIDGALATLPLDPRQPPSAEVYRKQVAELVPQDATPELRYRITRLAADAERRAARQWQDQRNQAGIKALDWIRANPEASLASMDRTISAALSPEQAARLDEIAVSGGRVSTNDEIYNELDRQAVHDPKSFAAADLPRYRLMLDDADHERFSNWQRVLADGRPDAAFSRYRLAAVRLDEEHQKLGHAVQPSEHRALRTELDWRLKSFESIEGRPAQHADINRVVNDLANRHGDIRTAGKTDVPVPPVPTPPFDYYPKKFPHQRFEDMDLSPEPPPYRYRVPEPVPKPLPPNFVPPGFPVPIDDMWKGIVPPPSDPPPQVPSEPPTS